MIIEGRKLREIKFILEIFLSFETFVGSRKGLKNITHSHGELSKRLSVFPKISFQSIYKKGALKAL
jgi:hypothetical protein